MDGVLRWKNWNGDDCFHVPPRAPAFSRGVLHAHVVRTPCCSFLSLYPFQECSKAEYHFGNNRFRNVIRTKEVPWRGCCLSGESERLDERSVLPDPITRNRCVCCSCDAVHLPRPCRLHPCLRCSISDNTDIIATHCKELGVNVNFKLMLLTVSLFIAVALSITGFTDDFSVVVVCRSFRGCVS